jgi:DNA-binding transcriptional LysR family regulator
MELRHIRYFLAVAEELHFRRAADRLHIAQPPLSKQIQELEQELGIQLFKRTRRSVELTDGGKAFQREAYNALACIEKGILKARLASRGEAGWLSIGFIGSSTYEVLPSVLQEFRQKFPDIELVLQEIQSSEQNQALREQRIHVSFARFPKPEPGLVFETIYKEYLVAALPTSHPLKEKKFLTLYDLANEPFILFPYQPSAHAENTLQVFAKANLSPQIIQTVEEMHTALGLVAARIGVTLVPSSMQKTKREGIVYLNLAKPQPELEMKMGYRESENSPVLPRFVEIVHSIFNLHP